MKLTNQLKQLGQFTPAAYAIVASAFIALLGPGILLLFHFKPVVFAELSTVKSVILAIAITLPVCLINLFATLPHSGRKEFDLADKENNPMPGLFFCACVLTAGVFYPAFILAYLFEMTFKGFLFLLGPFEALMFIATILSAALPKRIVGDESPAG